MTFYTFPFDVRVSCYDSHVMIVLALLDTLCLIFCYYVPQFNKCTNDWCSVESGCVFLSGIRFVEDKSRGRASTSVS